jgi:SAM-dependent methyltransferase
MPDLVSQYQQVEAFPSRLPGSAFSHAVAIHPVVNVEERARLIAECARLLAVYGQILVAMPVRGSFQEIADLLREYALKYDDFAVGRATEQAVLARPTIKSLAAEVTESGFDFVEDSLRPMVLRFRSGRDFFEDPIARLMILPEVRAELGPERADSALAYVREAIDKYWSDGDFELSVNIGCVSGRREP